MENKSEQRQLKIIGFTIPNYRNLAVEKTNQELTFKYDKNTYGKYVALTLSNGFIDAPDIDIHIEYDELVKLLKFLTDSPKLLLLNYTKWLSTQHFDTYSSSMVDAYLTQLGI